MFVRSCGNVEELKGLIDGILAQPDSIDFSKIVQNLLNNNKELIERSEDPELKEKLHKMEVRVSVSEEGKTTGLRGAGYSRDGRFPNSWGVL